MVIQSATYIREETIPTLVLETDLGEIVIDPTSIKMDMLEQDLVYVGYSDELPELPFSWQEKKGTQTEMVSGFTNDRLVLQLVRKFLNDWKTGPLKNGQVVYQG